MPYRVLILVMLIACALPGCGGDKASGRAPAAESAARAYVEAYDARDGRAICDAFVPALRSQIEQTAERVGRTCPSMVRAYIGYGEESDTPTFQHVAVRSVTAHLHGDLADVDVRESLSYKTNDPTRRRHSVGDVIHLMWSDGHWQVAKLGAIYYLSQSAYQIPPTVLDPPVTQAEAQMPAPRRGAPPECGGPVLADWDDPSGDAPPAVDLTRMEAVSAPGAICVRLVSGSIPPPGTVYSVLVEQPSGFDRTLELRTTVRVGHGGTLSVDSNTDLPGMRAGWDDDALELAVPLHVSQLDPRAPLHLSARLDSVQPLEPLITHPLRGGDEIRGDSFQGVEAPAGMPEPEPASPPQPPTLEECVEAWNADDPGRAPIGYDPLTGSTPIGAHRPSTAGRFIARTAWVSAQAGLGCGVDFRLGAVHAMFREIDGRWYGLNMLNPQLWQPPANACQTADGRLTAANSCPAVQVPSAQRRPLLEEYERFATQRVQAATANAGGPVWWLGPRPQPVALAMPDENLAWAAHALAAVVYTWQEPTEDISQVPPRHELVVLSYRRAVAPANLPCAEPCAYTTVARLRRGASTIIMIARSDEVPPRSTLGEMLGNLQPLPR